MPEPESAIRNETINQRFFCDTCRELVKPACVLTVTMPCPKCNSEMGKINFTPVSLLPNESELDAFMRIWGTGENNLPEGQTRLPSQTLNNSVKFEEMEISASSVMLGENLNSVEAEETGSESEDETLFNERRAIDSSFESVYSASDDDDEWEVSDLIDDTPTPLEIVENLQCMRINQDQVDQQFQCSICFEPFQLNQEGKKLECDHVYHFGCILTWLQHRRTCPICRRELTSTEDNSGDNGGILPISEVLEPIYPEQYLQF